MDKLYTTFYDSIINQKLAHFTNYNEMMPFIGLHWQQSKSRILFLGESHYIPNADLLQYFPGKNYLSDWYNNSSKDFDEYLSDYINTREVVNKADRVEEFGFASPLSIFYNIKAVLKKEIKALTDINQIFPFYSFYNYFQRAAPKDGISLENTDNDNEVAYKTLKSMVTIIHPQNIIFLSKKAYQAFNIKKSKYNEAECFKDIFIEVLPHPGSAWWYTVSGAYGNKTGKQKFTDIINSIENRCLNKPEQI